MLRRWTIDSSVTAYLKNQIESGNEFAAKSGLQHLCQLYRSGGRLRTSPELVSLEQSIVGLLYTRRDDPKLRRWALNAIAQLGRPETTLEVVLDSLERHRDDAQTLAAAIAALYRLDKKANQLLKNKAFPNEIVVLSALQLGSVPPEELAKVAINIETTTPDILKLSLITVGLNKAPENIFHPRHTNAAIVRVLGSHHDPIVSQYSIWAITENSNLSISDLGVPLKDVESKPANVRGWMYRLVASYEAGAANNIEYIRLGSEDREAEARMGLAHGLRKTYFDGLEELTLDWFPKEADREVHDRLIDHAVANAARCAPYERLALEFYEKEGPNSDRRRRMEATAAGTPIYAKFRKLSVEGGPSLFDVGSITVVQGDLVMAKNEFNVTGGIQAGAVALGGTAINSGTVQFDQKTLQQITAELTKAEREIHAIEGHPEVKKEALKLLTDAKAEPSPAKLKAAVGGLKRVSQVTGMAEKTVKSVGGIAQGIISLAGLVGTFF